jgi:hypothetical protein
LIWKKPAECFNNRPAKEIRCKLQTRQQGFNAEVSMAKPAFIYAFDNLGPERFVELCGLLLASHYKGFLLGGVGADGGVDGELDEILGEWHPESVSPLLNEVIQPERVVVFQFKHKVTARVGQAQARAQLLGLYQCQTRKTCELHRDLIVRRQPNAYVLVTNTEVNSEFRNSFIQQCRQENANVEHYQIIGLDELEMWITNEPELRHLYFPTIFGEARFNLKVRLSEGFTAYRRGQSFDTGNSIELFQVSVLNVGTVPSYVGSIVFVAIIDGDRKNLTALNIDNPMMELINPKRGTPLEPERQATYHFPFAALHQFKEQGREVFPVEVIVYDEIGNAYNAPIPDSLRDKILS